MFNHEPEDYICPFCNFLRDGKDTHNNEQDIVYQDEFTTAFIAPKWWVNNPGSVLVVSNDHHENIYDIPDEVLAKTYKTVKLVAQAIRSTYDCMGASTRQHNEPAGGQDVWHFHVHVFPRYQDDMLYQNDSMAAFVDADKRLPYADKLKRHLGSISHKAI